MTASKVTRLQSISQQSEDVCVHIALTLKYVVFPKGQQNRFGRRDSSLREPLLFVLNQLFMNQHSKGLSDTSG